MADEAVKRPGSRSHCRIVRHFALGAGRPTDSLAPCVGASTGDDLGLSLMLQIAAEPGNISQRPEAERTRPAGLTWSLHAASLLLNHAGCPLSLCVPLQVAVLAPKGEIPLNAWADENRTAQCACQRRGCGDAGLATAQPASQGPAFSTALERFWRAVFGCSRKQLSIVSDREDYRRGGRSWAFLAGGHLCAGQRVVAD